MNRTIISAPALPPEALAELKDWLAINAENEDAALIRLLQACIAACEAFTRATPIETEFEEVLPAGRTWQSLATSPVRAITAVDAIDLTGTRSIIDPVDYLLDITADGCGRINLLRAAAQTRIGVRFTAGLAADWAGLPDSMRHGIIRLAAHQYRERAEGGDDVPPASVAALWQPWRRLSLA